MPPTLAVSVDLDEVDCYHQIHGLVGAPGAGSRAVYEIAVPRLLALFHRLRVPATFFVVGSSLDPGLGAPAAGRMVEAGHEVANHTAGHPYDLLLLDETSRGHEVALGADAIEAATGRRPKGFRAPGYNVDDALLAMLEAEGYLYDSSVFPCAPYVAAKAAVMAAMRLAGRTSRSVLGPPGVLLAPTEPYLPGRRFWMPGRARGLVELPVAVMPVTRLPFIGTTLALVGPAPAAAMARGLARRRFVGLELHGIDALDGWDRDMAALAPHQPDLRVPHRRKLAAIEAAISALLAVGAEATTSEEAATRLTRSRPPS